MQAQFLWDMLLQRKRSDGSPQCNEPETVQGVAKKVTCLSEPDGDDQSNNDLPRQEHAVLTVELIRVRGGRVASVLVMWVLPRRPISFSEQ